MSAVGRNRRNRPRRILDDPGEALIDQLGWKGDDAVHPQGQVLGDSHHPETVGRVGDAYQDYLHAQVLGFFDGFGQVVIAGYEIGNRSCPVGGHPDQVQSQLQIDALLPTIEGDPSEPDLHTWQEADLLVLIGEQRVLGRVIPIRTQHIKAGMLLRALHDALDQLLEVDTEG